MMGQLGVQAFHRFQRASLIECIERSLLARTEQAILAVDERDDIILEVPIAGRLCVVGISSAKTVLLSREPAS